MEEPPMEEPMGDAPEDVPFDKEPFDAGVEASEENEPKKFIQQLSGKLGQSLRKYTQDTGLDLELEKFAINSLLSATHTAEMDQEDKQDIIKRVENSGDEPEEEPEAESNMEMEDPNITGASNPASAPGGEGGAPMGENIEILPKEHKQVFKDAKLGVNESVPGFDGSIDGLKSLMDKYSRMSDVSKELNYYLFHCELNNRQPDEESIEMILNNNGVLKTKMDHVYEDGESVGDSMSIEDLEMLSRELGASNGLMDEDNEENTLSVNNKKDSFVDDSIKRMMQDYLNTEKGFEENLEPQIKPQVKPDVAPVKVPRRSKPWRTTPRPNPAPKGIN
jgi:hypothetical protein